MRGGPVPLLLGIVENTLNLTVSGKKYFSANIGAKSFHFSKSILNYDCKIAFK